MKKLYKVGIIVLINIYLVIIAGSVVRMTGSGMGCPDWPKCFGYLIPPTSQEQIEWKQDREFKKGQIIISQGNEDKHLLVAQKDFTSLTEFDEANWVKYQKHDYAIFNVYHTWTEYVNRLMGALLGLFALLMLALSIKNWKKDKTLTLLSLFQLFFIGFEAWLGKVTVDSNLAPETITYHMLGVLVLIFVQAYFLIRTKQLIANKPPLKLTVNKQQGVVLVTMALLIIQIIIGTQVRQQVDELIDAEVSRDLIVDNFTAIFYVHRSFSLLLLLSIGFIVFKNIKSTTLKITSLYIAITVILEVFAGMFLAYLGMQAIGQPFHLFLSILMFGFLAKIFFKTSKTY